MKKSVEMNVNERLSELEREFGEIEASLEEKAKKLDGLIEKIEKERDTFRNELLKRIGEVETQLIDFKKTYEWELGKLVKEVEG